MAPVGLLPLLAHWKVPERSRVKILMTSPSSMCSTAAERFGRCENENNKGKINRSLAPKAATVATPQPLFNSLSRMASPTSGRNSTRAK